MRTLYFSLIIASLFLSGCRNNSTSTAAAPTVKAFTEATFGFQAILDSAGLKGSILIFDPAKRTFYSNDFQWARKGHLPASTFKIPNSIIALETGVIANEDVVIPWDGTTRNVDTWNQDLAFHDAFSYSCVPCYQGIARSIGGERMRQYLDRLDYPGITFQPEDLDMFWLQGESKINQFEQIEFLERLHDDKLPITAATNRIMRTIMRIETSDSYTLSGKTGWSQADEKNNGWFVGFVERPSKNAEEIGDQILYFATNIEPKEGTPISNFRSGRRNVTTAAIQSLNWP